MHIVLHRTKCLDHKALPIHLILWPTLRTDRELLFVPFCLQVTWPRRSKSIRAGKRLFSIRQNARQTAMQKADWGKNFQSLLLTYQMVCKPKMKSEWMDVRLRKWANPSVRKYYRDCPSPHGLEPPARQGAWKYLRSPNAGMGNPACQRIHPYISTGCGNHYKTWGWCSGTILPASCYSNLPGKLCRRAWPLCSSRSKVPCRRNCSSDCRLSFHWPWVDWPNPGCIFQTGVDFAANRLPPPYVRTFPIGLDVEVVSMPALEKPGANPKLSLNGNTSCPTFINTRTYLK